jgi:hypothetical protein
MADNLEVMIGRIDERTEHIEADIIDLKVGLIKVVDTVKEHGEKLASIETTIGNNHGLSKRQTAGIGGGAGFIIAAIVAFIDYFVKH